jgi:cation:H+ antiporter
VPAATSEDDDTTLSDVVGRSPIGRPAPVGPGSSEIRRGGDPPSFVAQCRAMLLHAVFLLIGVALLYLGGEGLVDGASRLAQRLGVSTLVIGLTIVAFGTSAPELAATLTATVDGAPDLGLGNVVGSNIANIGLVLGLSAVLLPLHTTTRFLLRELVFMIGCAVLMIPILADGVIGRGEGLLLGALLLGYLGFLYASGQAPEVDGAGEDEPGGSGLFKAIALVVVGGALLLLGAKSLVFGAVTIARDLGISERVIGLTMVAVGTSLPELAASLVAARKGDSDMILGNVVGSNIFNVLCILGVTATSIPMVVDASAAELDVLAMLGFSVVVPLLLWRGRRMGRIEGSLLLVGWAAYVISLVVRTSTGG